MKSIKSLLGVKGLNYCTCTCIHDIYLPIHKCLNGHMHLSIETVQKDSATTQTVLICMYILRDEGSDSSCLTVFTLDA